MEGSEGLQETLGCSFCLIGLLEPHTLPVQSFLWFVASAIASSSSSEGHAGLGVREAVCASALSSVARTSLGFSFPDFET